MRNRWGLIVMVTLLVLVVGRLALLQGVDGAAYANAAEQDRLRTYPVAAVRGEVLDRNGRPFAYTVEASRVTADPAVVDDPERTALALTTLLDVPVPELTEKLSEDSRYVVLATQISPETVDAIEALELPGVLFEDDPVRLYPAGAVGGQVVGFVGRDGTGLAGIEQTFEDELSGTPGERTVEVGSGGNPIPSGIDESTPAVDGSTVQLTLDQDLQYVMEQRLAEACSDGATTRASAVVLDVQTGEVVAMGSCPGYDPASYSSTDPDLLGNPVVSRRLRARLGDEGRHPLGRARGGRRHPGHGAERQRAHRGRRPDGHRRPRPRADRLDRDRDPRQVQQRRHDHAGPRGGGRDPRGVHAGLRHRQHAPGSSCPARAPASSRPSSEWDPGRAANVPIGQGVSVTTLQMASMYQTIANDGVRDRAPPRLVGHRPGRPRRRRRPSPRAPA